MAAARIGSRKRRFLLVDEVGPKDLQRLRPIFEGLRYNLVVDSILDGNTPAWIYADEIRQPQVGWLWNRMDAMLVAGNARNPSTIEALALLLADRAFPDARQRAIPQLSLHYDPKAWEHQVDRILGSSQPVKAGRRYYRLDGLKVDWRAEIPSMCQIWRMDEDLLASGHLENVETMVGWVRSFWRSTKDFVRTGFGYCLVVGESVASWCLSVYASGRDFELGLATAPAFRGRGFATLTSAACVEHCLTHDLTPQWHCWEDNIASGRVADKVGFAHPTRYEVYRFEP